MSWKGPEVSVVVVSRDTREITCECVRRVLESRNVCLEVIVVDNASSDGTVAALAGLDDIIDIIPLDENRGFGAANNVAYARAHGDLVLFLNSDAMVEPSTISLCRDILLARPHIGAVACQLRNADGSIQPSCRRFPTISSEFLRVFFRLGWHTRVAYSADTP